MGLGRGGHCPPACIFRDRLDALDASKLSAATALDCRLLRLRVDNDLFQVEDLDELHKNPMVYAEALDLNTYLKRDYAPLADRLRSIVSIEKQVPAMFAAARENLAANVAQADGGTGR